MPDRRQRIAGLLDWLRGRGASFPKIEVVCGRDGQASVVAREPLHEGEVLIQVPWDSVLDMDEAGRGAYASALSAAGVEFDRQAQIALYLLEARDSADSPWHAYLGSLPRAYPTMPIFYDAEHLAYLQGCYALDAVMSRNRRFREEYRRIREVIPAFGYSLDDYRWARTAVYTRCFRVRRGEDKVRVMIPLMDLLNHHLSKTCEWGTREDIDGVACWTNRAVAAGEELLISYGSGPLSRQFVAYGFLNPDRSYDDARIVLWLPVSDPLYDKKCRVLPATRRTHHFIGRAYDEGFRELLAVARILSLTDLSPQAAAAFVRHRPLSLENERVALKAVIDACDQALARFPTDIDDDRKFIERSRGKEDTWVLAGVEYGMREKQVLVDCLVFLRAASALLQLPPAALQARLETLEQRALSVYLGELDVALADVAEAQAQ